MRNLIIKNFGPIQEANIEMSRMNILVGPQSIGKSCALKIAAFFAWLEKRLELTQNPEVVLKNAYKVHFIDYFGLNDYDRKETSICYETDRVKIVYEGLTMSAEWKKDRWNYRRTKISYIPSERNILSVISNWAKVDANDSLLEYFSDWDEARKSLNRGLDILFSGVQYSYDDKTGKDLVRLKNGKTLLLSETSSGFQSLIPLYVHLYYLRTGQYQVTQKINYSLKTENERLLQILLDRLPKQKITKEILDSASKIPYLIERDDELVSVIDNKEISDLINTYRNFVYTKRSDVFLEEPENNLFPPTQVQLIQWLIALATDKFRRNSMFIATHSPYVVNCFLERPERDYKLFIAAPVDSEGKSIIHAASDEDLQKMYDFGVDVFFNYESFIG